MASDDGTAVHVWDRWERLWHGVFFVALAVPTTVALARPDATARGRLTIALLAGGFALWHWLLAVRHPQWARRPGLRLLCVGGMAVFTWALVPFDPVFAFLVYGLYPQMFVLLGRWGIAGAVAVTLLVFPRSGILGPGPQWETVLSVAGSTVSAVILGLFIHGIASQSERRKQALDELEAARGDMADAARHAGMLEERQRMAREIHDTVAQGLASVVMLLEAADQELPDAAGPARAHIEQARSTARESLADIRRSVLALRPDLLEHASLPAALAVVVERWSQRTGTAASARVLGEPYPLHPDTEVTLLRTAQEALANVAKHAGARSVTVTLAFADDETTLDIRDDGQGFQPRRARSGASGGFGLTGLRQRIAQVGGRLAVDSGPSAGTTIVAAVPRSPGGAR